MTARHKGRAPEPATSPPATEHSGNGSKLSPRRIYESVLRDGREELRRPLHSLIWSGIAAGILISFSVLGEAILRSHMPDTQWRFLIENAGYSLGFLLVILGRMQLFTENTITTVLPVVTDRSPACLGLMLRLWSVVLGANVIGATVAAWFLSVDGVLMPGVEQAVAEISAHATGMGARASFLKAIPAGILVAAIVWMLPSAPGGGFAVILAFTWLIAAGDFTHVIAGSVELAYMLFTTEMGFFAASLGYFLPVLAGNVIGGTLVFALLAWAQIKQEVEPKGDALREPEGKRA